ncbi:MAG: sigma-70 family RNA polymerase sigma factor [Bryobacteraceae bacterium]
MAQSTLASKLWASFRTTPDPSWDLQREALVLEQIPTVRRIARQMSWIFAHADLEDLVQTGYVGLMQAVDRFQPGSGDFAPFAWFRIRGAIVDSQKRAAFRNVFNQSLDAIAERNDGWLPPEFDCDRGALPDELAVQAQISERLAAAIESLPERERQVLVAKLAGKKQAKIARELGLSVAAVDTLWADARWWVGIFLKGQ